jgi:hypothetical protein
MVHFLTALLGMFLFITMPLEKLGAFPSFPLRGYQEGRGRGYLLFLEVKGEWSMYLATHMHI